MLGFEDESVYQGVHEAISYLTEPVQSTEKLLEYCLNAGKVNFTVMELLDRAHTETFGHPVPTTVKTTPVKGKAILISGHDLKSLAELPGTDGRQRNQRLHAR